MYNMSGAHTRTIDTRTRTLTFAVSRDRHVHVRVESHGVNSAENTQTLCELHAETRVPVATAEQQASHEVRQQRARSDGGHALLSRQ